MTALKLLGGVLIIASGIAASVGAVARERRRLAVLDAWISLIGLIKSQIDLYLTPLSEILEHAEPRILRLLADASDKPPSLSGMLAHTAPDLDVECQRELAILLQELGSSYREEQIKQCGYCMEALQKIRDRQALELPQKTRLYTTLCLCSSLGVLILLW